MRGADFGRAASLSACRWIGKLDVPDFVWPVGRLEAMRADLPFPEGTTQWYTGIKLVIMTGWRC